MDKKRAKSSLTWLLAYHTHAAQDGGFQANEYEMVMTGIELIYQEIDGTRNIRSDDAHDFAYYIDTFQN
jgi:hypothetical protein